MYIDKCLSKVYLFWLTTISSVLLLGCSPYQRAIKRNHEYLISQQEQKLRELQRRLLQLKEDSLELARQADELVIMLGESRQRERQNAQRLYLYGQIVDKASLYQQQLEYIRRQITHTLLIHEIDNIQVVKEETGVRITILDELLFESGSAVLNSSGQRALAVLSQMLKGITGISLTIEGHTDNIPVRHLSAYRSNWELSLARASEAARYMVSYAFPPDRIRIVGKGELHPLASNETPEGRRLNRRTEIVVSPLDDELMEAVFEGVYDETTVVRYGYYHLSQEQLQATEAFYQQEVSKKKVSHKSSSELKQQTTTSPSNTTISGTAELKQYYREIFLLVWLPLSRWTSIGLFANTSYYWFNKLTIPWLGQGIVAVSKPYHEQRLSTVKPRRGL